MIIVVCIFLLVLCILNQLRIRNLNKKIDAVLEYAKQLAEIANARAEMLDSISKVKEDEDLEE